MGPRCFACASVLALALAVAPGRVHAEPSKADIAHAAELKKHGDELSHVSKFREALQAYDESFAIVHDPAILYNRGRAFQQLGDFPAALDAFDKFAQTAPEALKSRVPTLKEMIAEVASHVATIVIKCPVEGATVTIRGKTEGTTPLAPLRTTIGDASIDVTAPGYAPFHKDASLAAGTTAIDVDLVKAGAMPTPQTNDVAPSSSPPPTDEAPAKPGRGWKIVTFGAGAVGIAGIASGMIFFGVALAKKGDADSHCPDKACDPTGRAALDDGQTFATVSTVLVVVGAVGLAAAATAFIVTPKSAPVEARLIVGPGFGGIGGTW